MGHIQRHHLTEALVLVPNATLLHHADTVIRPLFDRALALRLESRALTAQRDALLPRLVGGEVRVELSLIHI